MSRKLASVQTIIALDPIEGADSIEVATVLGWKCVVKKGQFKVGQKVIYFEVDSLLPMIPAFDFLKARGTKKIEDGTEGYKLKTIRLKGQISQGLVMPTSDFYINTGKELLEDGDDVTDIIGVKLWQPIIPACLRGKIKGTFPSFIPKTDETRVQILGKVIARHAGTECYVTEKLDGSSITCWLKDGVFGIASRNMELDVNDDGNAYVKTVKELKIEEKMRDYFSVHMPNVAIQGELVGTGIQGNSLMIQGHDIYWFNVFNIDKFEYSGYNLLKSFTEYEGLKTVPILEENYILPNDVDAIVKKAVGKSVINPKSDREGIVIRPIREKLDLEMSRGMSNARLSFKSINLEYLLKHDDA